MKICDKCGTRQDDTRTRCLDCDEMLGKSISEKQENEIKQENEEKIEKLYNKNLYVSLPEKIVGIGSLIGIIITIVFAVIYRRNLGYAGEYIFAIISFAFSALLALAPGILWELEKIRLSFSVDLAEDEQPSDFYRNSSKIAVFALFVLGVIFLVITILHLLNPPIVVW